MLPGFCLEDVEDASEMMMSLFVLKQYEKMTYLMLKFKDWGNLVLWGVEYNLVLAPI